MTERTAVPPYMDPYTRSADHLDLLSAGLWQHMAPHVSAALAGIGENDATIVELGSGTGLGTCVIARTAPMARIVAVEPSSHLRAVLLHRVASDNDLRSRVTVENRPFPSSRLPEKFDALVMINSLGHLDYAERAQLWRVIAAGLRPGGCAVINLQAPTTSSAVPEFEMARERVGDREYHGSARAERVDEHTMIWHMTYRTSEEGHEIDAAEVEYRWNVLDAGTLESELAQHNLHANAAGDEQFGVFAIESDARRR
ncbi:class I SAM-dependent methyltransferase [Rhodococcus sp. SMB37]|uniref:class I SAM-dependent methyltransferase n=1 Tax=Rhodococcus sp. SMB37 TaxID=2512213 RepID=UPI0006D1A33D|nr:class I SAM-dependent methyltransferase [Rhodococcus sp. SMB37]